jgi:hypothetical protein
MKTLQIPVPSKEYRQFYISGTGYLCSKFPRRIVLSRAPLNQIAPDIDYSTVVIDEVPRLYEGDWSIKLTYEPKK